MRGLPPPPIDTMSWRVTWEINDEPLCSCTFWLYSQFSQLATYAQLSTFLGDLLLSPLNDLLAVLPSVVSPGVSRLTSYGTTNREVVTGSPAVFGALGGQEPLNSALVLTWATESTGRGARGHSFLPLAGEMLSADPRRLNTDEWSNAIASANAFIGHIAAITPPWLQPVEQVVLQRQEDGRPLPASFFSPVLLGGASPLVGTLRRRISGRGQISSWA